MLGKFDGQGCLGKVLHARLLGGLGSGWCLEIAWVHAQNKCLGCSNQEVLGKSSSHNTTSHHNMEAIVVSMG